jgi:TonB family protein
MDAKSLRERKCFHCCTMTSKTKLLALLLLCPGLISASAEQAPSAQQLLDANHKATDLSSAGAYSLEATLVVNPGNPKFERRAKLMIVRDHDRARFTLESDGHTEERVALGAKQYIVPGQGALSAMGLRDFDYSWDPGRPPHFNTNERPSFGDVRKQKIQGKEAWCFDRKLPQAKTKLCFDAAKSMLVHEASTDSHTEYSDYASLGASMYPQRVQVFRGNMAPFELDQISITPAHTNEDLFKAPQNALEIERCEDEKPPVAISTPEPSFPSRAKDARQEAISVINVVLNNEGKVVSAEALGPDSYGFGNNSVDSIKSWRFKPATCNGRPVATELNVEMSFRLH